ncbi:hypothetical protein [Reinekea sp. G2M2-21]|uniref:hypothetical protein n=1 Tax=Reinekea sp. G2M2-21 TaxID=2788942 RepID=UPI0018AB9AF4|nr:hypothetical protein [Reinekea sp. G2M2-21]
MKLIIGFVIGIIIGSSVTFFVITDVVGMAGTYELLLSFNNGNTGIAKGLIEDNKKGVCYYLIEVMKYNQHDLFMQTDIPNYLEPQFSWQKENNLEMMAELERYIESGGQNCQ